MRRIGFLASVVALAAVALGTGSALGGSSTRSEVVSFTSSWSGRATVVIDNNVADIRVEGTGQATLLGAGKITGSGKGDASAQPCVPFTGTGEMTSTTGSSSLEFTVLLGSSGCGDEAGKVFSVNGRAKVTGGKGDFANATGTLKLTGVYDHGGGTFSVKLNGKVTTSGTTTAPKTTVLKISSHPTKLAFSTKTLVAPAGKVTIRMTNRSSLPHNVALRAGATAKGKIIAKGKVVKKSGTSTVTAILKPGKYRYACTVPGHEAGGMWGVLTVK